ncbi:hypothetical protein [Streptomyces sp. NPDC001020]
MPADEVAHGTDAEESRERTGPRHAAPRKPLFTRFHMPAGKAMALAAMPTALLMGMGLNSSLARADDKPAAKSLTADEYQKCVEALTGSEDSKDASATPSPSASASASKSTDTAEPTPSGSADETSDNALSSAARSRSDGKVTHTPSASSPTPSAGSPDTSSATDAPAPTPSASASGGNLLDDLGNALKDALTPGDGSSTSDSATPSPSASATEGSSDSAAETARDTAEKATDTVEDTAKDTADTTDPTDTADTTAKETSEATPPANDTVQPSETASPSPSESATPSADECPAATDAEGGVENIVALPDDPWQLQASSLLLKSADYQGVVKVRTANGTVKKVLKYVISGGTDIGDLHQLVVGPNGLTYHVQAAKGSTSTIRDGDTVMYTESISGNLFGLIPVTFSPDKPPPLNIPLIYFTKVKVTQAGQFGGTLRLPGMHQYVTGAS